MGTAGEGNHLCQSIEGGGDSGDLAAGFVRNKVLREVKLTEVPEELVQYQVHKHCTVNVKSLCGSMSAIVNSNSQCTYCIILFIITLLFVHAVTYQCPQRWVWQPSHASHCVIIRDQLQPASILSFGHHQL